MVIGEADGEGKYRDASAFAHEKIREGHLRDLGHDVCAGPDVKDSAPPVS